MITRCEYGCYVTLGLAALLMAAPPAPGQEGGRSTMVMEDGDTRRVLHFAQPDVRAALAPDILPADVPLFVEQLRLSEAQRRAVRDLIDEYLDALDALTRAQHPDPVAPPGQFRPERLPQGAASAPPGTGEAAPREEKRAEDPVHDIILDELRQAGFDINSLEDLPVRPSIAIGMELGDDMSGELEEGPQPNVDVSISFDAVDDGLSDEDRAKLQAAADRMVPRITECMRAQAHIQMEAANDLVLEGENGIDAKWREITALRERIEAFRQAKHQLLQTFLANVQALLAEAQMERWPIFERALRRTKTLPLGTLDGEGTDLLALLDEIELSESEQASIAEARDAYARQLHAALGRRNDLLEHVDGEIDQAMYEGKAERALALTERLVRARVAIRSLNDRSIEEIASLLTAPHAAQFRAAALAESCPRVFRRTLGERAFAAALELPDLAPDLRESIVELERLYRQQLDAVNGRLHESIRRHQAEAPRADIERALDLMAGDTLDGLMEDRRAIRQAFQARQRLDLRSIRSLYGLMAPEQVQRLPPLPATDPTAPIVAEHSEIELDPQEP